MTPTEIALIAPAAALLGVVIAFAGNAYLDRLKDRRAAKRARDTAIAELLTATADLLTGFDTVRLAYQHKTRYRHYLRTIAVAFAAINAAFATASEVSWSTLADWRRGHVFLDRLLDEDRQLDSQHRTMILDLNTMLVAKTIRFYEPVATLTLGPDKEITSAARELARAVRALLEVAGARDRRYAPARQRAEDALGEFRDAADQRH